MLVCPLVLLLISSCGGTGEEHSFSDLDAKLQLEARLQESEFDIITSSEQAVEMSWSIIGTEGIIPDTWHLDFSGSDITIPDISPESCTGILHPNGRVTAVYTFPDPQPPPYGELVPIAIAHYMVTEPELDILLLIVAFQADPDNNPAGIGVRTVDTDGYDLSAPFSIALDESELAGMFFYDEYIESDAVHSMAARTDWDRGFLLLTRLNDSIILSTYVPWY